MDEPGCRSNEVSAAILQLPELHRAVLMRLYGMGGGPPVSRKRLALQLGVPLDKIDALRDDALRMLRRPPCAGSPVQAEAPYRRPLAFGK